MPPIEVVWSPLAVARLREIRAFIATEQPKAAERLALRLLALVQALRLHPQLGRATGTPGVRELAVGGTPYAILYKKIGPRIVIVTIRHGSQGSS